MSALFASNRENLPPSLPGFDHINRYWDKVHNKYAAKILPGEYYVTSGSELIVTVLGSCVSACIRDKQTGVGGMNHFMLPMQNIETSWQDTKVSAATRYGNFAMEHLINDIFKFGGKRSRLEIKIFGGGKILKHMTDIGEKNISFVKEYIHTEGFEVAAADLGDIYPRKVIYFPKTGKVRMKRLMSLHNHTILDRETAYMDELKTKPVEGEIDLF